MLQHQRPVRSSGGAPPSKGIRNGSTLHLMPNSSLTPLQRQIYWSAPSPVIERGRRRTAFGLLLVLGVERLLREGRLRGPQARLAMAQAQAARLLAAPVTGAAWKTRRGDVLRHDGDELAAALVAKAMGDETELSAGACLISSCDLLDEICDWLSDGQLLGAVCTVDKQSKSLFVAGMKDAPNPQFVHCSHLERVFPIMDLLHRIVRTAGFNGNGCVNFKYTPQTMTQEALDAYMHDIPTVLPGEAVPLYTWFGDRRLLVEGAQYEAAARVFEVNPRVCGPVKDQDVLIDMIRLYMDDFYL